QATIRYTPTSPSQAPFISHPLKRCFFLIKNIKDQNRYLNFPLTRQIEKCLENLIDQLQPLD
ncbi:hypothetical protein, partial [Bartonella sp. AP58NXGY]|uniref:hypothetical protein n=1 Tax=Bartonella sp. AP58NXGY TaxID=3243498 RepID=UPI0035CE90EF